MKIDWKITHIDCTTVSHLMFSNLARLTGNIRRCGKAVFGISRHSKTSLDIDVSSGDPSCSDAFAVAHVPKGTEDLSFVTTTSYSFLDGTRHVRCHFRLSKRQGLPELKRYLSAILEEMLPGMESVEAELVINRIPELS